eukprot:5038586-Prymnesium_polylepis.2
MPKATSTTLPAFHVGGALLPRRYRPSIPCPYPPGAQPPRPGFPDGHPSGLPPSMPHGLATGALPGARQGLRRMAAHALRERHSF